MESQSLFLQALALERIEVNLFRARSMQGAGRLFGGQVIAQSLMAAYETVEDRACHSLHCYFIRPGDARVPVLYEVDRARDGGSFTTRRVIAIQHGKQIFNLAASFQAHEQGLEHSAPMPEGPGPDAVASDYEEKRKQMLEAAGDDARARLSRPMPIEIRTTDSELFSEVVKPPRTAHWMRLRDALGTDPRMHQAMLAYASDMTLLSTAMRPHGVTWQTRGLQSASLDHAMWFHRPSNFNQWHLYAQESPSASGGRGLVLGTIYALDGTLVASTAQEGLMRMRKVDG